MEPFSQWTKLQAWLLNNYAPPDPELDAMLAMTQICMDAREGVQSFLNCFETIVADLSWNDSAIVATLHTKITPRISETIHML